MITPREGREKRKGDERVRRRGWNRIKMKGINGNSQLKAEQIERNINTN